MQKMYKLSIVLTLFYRFEKDDYAVWKGEDKSVKWMDDHESPIYGPEGSDYLQFTYA